MAQFTEESYTTPSGRHVEGTGKRGPGGTGRDAKDTGSTGLSAQLARRIKTQRPLSHMQVPFLVVGQWFAELTRCVNRYIASAGFDPMLLSDFAKACFLGAFDVIKMVRLCPCILHAAL